MKNLVSLIPNTGVLYRLLIKITEVIAALQSNGGC